MREVEESLLSNNGVLYAKAPILIIKHLMLKKKRTNLMEGIERMRNFVVI